MPFNFNVQVFVIKYNHCMLYILAFVQNLSIVLTYLDICNLKDLNRLYIFDYVCINVNVHT